MTMNRYAPLIVVCALSSIAAGCKPATDPSAPAQTDEATVATASAAIPASTDTAAMTTDIPQGFSSYASESIGDGKQCVAGATRDEDGMNQRPVAYLAQTSGKPIWTRSLDLPADTYQSRATHCVLGGDSIYVLLQSDTQPAQTTSQTLLKVVRLGLSDGAVRGSGDVVVDGVDGAYSAFADEGAQRLRWENDGVHVSGEYFRLDDPDRRIAFQATLKSDLSR